MDLRAKLEQARLNVQAIGQQFAQKRDEAEGVKTLLIKWQGICEYLESVIRDEEAAKPSGEPAWNGTASALALLPDDKDQGDGEMAG